MAGFGNPYYGLILGQRDEFTFDAYYSYSIGGRAKVVVTRTGAGAAVIDFAVSGAISADISSPGSAVLEIVTDGRITSLLDGAGNAILEFTADAADGSAQTGEASMEFIAAAIGAYTRRNSRVITNQKNAPGSLTAVGSRASVTSFRAPRSHTEVTNG